MTDVAIVHDYLTQRGGAERVVLALARVFPDAPVYTSVFEPSTTFPEFADLDVRTSPLQKLSVLRRDHRLGLALYAPAFSMMTIEADTVLCNSSGWSHGVRTAGRKIVYCHAPARWLYQRDRYLGEARRSLTGIGLQVLAPALRAWDRRAAQSADLYLANSSASQTMIRDAYGIEAPIVHCPYGLDPDGEREPVAGVAPGALLCVSRLLPYKNVAAVIDAAASTGQPLVVVGSGPDRQRLGSLAGPHVTFLETVTDDQLRWLYANASLLVAASYEDLGLTPIEAATLGLATVALDAGGYRDTVVAGVTGVFFDEPTGSSIAQAIQCGLARTWSPAALRAHAENFSPAAFERAIRRQVAPACCGCRPGEAGDVADNPGPDRSDRGCAVRAPASADTRRRRRVALMPSAFHPSLGGVEELTARLAAEQLLIGGAPMVASMRWPPELSVRETIAGVPVWRGRFCLPEPDLRSLARFARRGPTLLWMLVRELRRHRAEIVHVQCVSSNGLFAWVAARALRLPLVVTLQGELSMDADAAYRRTVVLPWVLRRLLRHADAVTACSAQTLAEGEAFARVELGARGRVIHNGVSIAELDGAVPEVRERPFLFAIGRHVSQKGFDVLLEAVALTNITDTFDLVIAGDGPERARLEQLASTLGLTRSVDFVGRTDRTRTTSLFRGCELFVLPSRHEPMGIVNLEAMASGKAVIATRVGGVPEIVIDGVTGVLVPPDDAQALARALTHALSDPALLAELGMAGRSRAERFDWPLVAPQYDDVYQWALGQR